MWLVALLFTLSGCDDAPAAADPAPFESAVARYLTRNDMALRLKEIRQGPLVDGDQATMSASMTHRDLGGPSVVWEFQFRRGDDGQWTVVSHQD